jgi:3-methyl-2-oxobutanoate hydroxymethyltransferase
VDCLLVGDSVGMVLYGEESTLPVTMDLMIPHVRAVTKGCKYALVVADMPFMSYQPSQEIAIINAGRFLSLGGAGAVKLEGGLEMAAAVKRIVECGIPVMGHIGHTPQSIHRFGDPHVPPRVQGRKEKSRQYLIESARALEEAGAFAIVLELVQAETAAEITRQVGIPTIGIGAGKECDGQVLVINDVIGMYDEFVPTFVRRYAEVAPLIEEAARRFAADVRSGAFPGENESFY